MTTSITPASPLLLLLLASILLAAAAALPSLLELSLQLNALSSSNAPPASAASVVGFSCDDANCTGPPSSPSNVIGPLPADVCCTIHDPDGNPPFGAMVRLATTYPRTTHHMQCTCVPEQ